jgi:HSP20 family protein
MNNQIQAKTHAQNGGVSVVQMRPAADIFENDSEFQIVLEVPGVNQSDVDISVDRDTLTVSATRSGSGETVTRYARAFSIPRDVDRAAVDATLNAGELTLRLPKQESYKPRKVAVQSA